MSEERDFVNEEYRGSPSATKRRLERLADADDPEAELVLMEKDRMRQQLKRARKTTSENDPGGPEDPPGGDPMDPVRLEEEALAQAGNI